MTMASTIYGPVKSWRFGNSLGVDLLFQTSICSFDCIYCQLGRIQRVTSAQAVYVETERVLSDLMPVDWGGVDVVTFSGNGEPTLALNIGDVIDAVKDHHKKPVMVLTNATMLTDAATRQRLARADTVACKLDAWDDAMLARMNRPVAGVTLERIVEGIRLLKKEKFPQTVALQCMLMPTNIGGIARLAELVAELAPDEVQLNTPKRPYPRAWHLENRGNHDRGVAVETTTLRTITLEDAREAEHILRARNPGVRILSVYGEG